MSEADRLDLRRIVRPGDTIVWGQAAGEPLTLIERLIEQRADLGGVSVFMGSAFSKVLKPEHADHLKLAALGGIGTLRRFTQAACLDIVPCHVGQIYRYIEQGLIGCDVAFVQLSPPGPDSRHSFGVSHDYLRTAIDRARVVVAEINDRAPWTYGEANVAPEEIHHAIHTSRPLIEIAPVTPGPAELETARLAAGYIEDGSVLQIGIGAVPDAILRMVADRRDLGIHSGMIGDGVADLIEAGVVTNARKPIDTGITIAGLLIGTKRLYDFAHLNPAIGMRSSAYTHGETALAAIPKLVTINAAVEVDLTGQINAEQAGDGYMGGVGGHADYVRAGHRSPGGHSIVALSSMAAGGTLSRITAALSGPVTSPRSDADVVVTEFGAAELRAQPLPERARRLIAIAHPDFREALERQAFELFRRGF